MNDPSKPRTKTLRVLLGFGFAVCLVAGSALAQGGAINCGKVSIEKGQDQAFLEELRRVVREHIARLNEASWEGGPYVVNVALLELSTQSGQYGLQTTAVVQAVVVNQDSGNLLGGIRGRATAASGGRKHELAASSAMRRAAENALSQVERVTTSP